MPDAPSSLPVPSAKPTHGLPAHLASPEARGEHRIWIAGAIKTLLTVYDAFPIDHRVAAELGQMWANDLEWFPQSVISEAIDAYRRAETRRPVPAAIIKLCRERMPRPRLVKAEEPPRERCTPEQARAILAEAGYAPRRIDGGE